MLIDIISNSNEYFSKFDKILKLVLLNDINVKLSKCQETEFYTMSFFRERILIIKLRFKLWTSLIHGQHLNLY